MTKPKTKAPAEKEGNKGKQIRTKDDLELLCIILGEDPILKNRVMRKLEAALGRTFQANAEKNQP